MKSDIKKKIKRNAFGIFIFLLILATGGFALYLAFFGQYEWWQGMVSANAELKRIVMMSGGVVALLGLIGLIICSARISKLKQSREEIEANASAIDPSQGRLPIGNYVPNQPTMNYISSENVAEYVKVGDVQSVEQKFEQIGKMGKTQFVVYVARLFAQRGYRVKLTPVADNHGVDLIVEKDKVSIAVGCILSEKVLSDKAIRPIIDGKDHYNAHSCMAVTNMYFDKSAVEEAKQNHVSLIDRSVLIEDFL